MNFSRSATNSEKSSCFVKSIWLINLLLLITLLLITAAIFFFPKSINAATSLYRPVTTNASFINVLSPTSSTISATPTPYITKTPTPTITINHPPILSSTTAQPALPTKTLTPIPTSTPSLQTHQKPLIIGFSTRGNPLEVYQFGSGISKRMIVAGIHGGYEWNTVKLADELIAYLSVETSFIPENTTLYILRNLNPDGLERTHGIEGRANANNVDLNRNWDAFWKSDWPQTGCWSYKSLTAGPYPMSESETTALASFLSSQHIEALINYHSAALGIFPGGQPADPQSVDLAESIAAISSYPYPPLDTGCEFTGQLIDWASQQGVASVDIELSNHTDSEFNINLKILKTFLNWSPEK